MASPRAEAAIRVLCLMALCLSGGAALAGGPLVVDANGQAVVWSAATPIAYRTDNGPLSASVNEAAARARVAGMFQVWTDVPSASISFNRAGFIIATGAFSDGDVSTGAEFDAVELDCINGNQSPIVYDADGAIFVDLGVDETSVLGFAGPCAAIGTQFVAGRAAMNGLFQDGQAAPDDVSADEFDTVFVHEFGHFVGLDHSQINLNCLQGCGNDDLDGLPTMFPFLVSDAQLDLSTDDIAWISRLYPDPAPGTGFAATHGTITGLVFFSDGESHAQLVNVIARRVDNPATAGVDESRIIAASNVSGYKFRLFLGNPINQPDGDVFGTVDPAHIGLYEIPVPAGDYTIEVESIDPQFVDGSRVGAPFVIPMPGAAPAPIGPITIAAGVTAPADDVVLIGTQPRFDQFEGP